MLVVSVLVLLAVRTWVASTWTVSSASMEPALRVGDRLLVDRTAYRRDEVRRGDVVVFDGTDSFGAGASGRTYVKRVIGVGGDRVVCCDGAGRITVDGRALDESAYLPVGEAPSTLRFDVEVPAGELWLLGDHRSQSADSRAHLGDPGGGTVPEHRVLGRVAAVVWPPGRAAVGSP